MKSQATFRDQCIANNACVCVGMSYFYVSVALYLMDSSNAYYRPSVVFFLYNVVQSKGQEFLKHYPLAKEASFAASGGA